ncbi:hypothetical protein MTCD1_02092 [Colwellia marinimaniae]|uniref:Uncharacterized protein n=1 Tax=Colwellia marinimaniae TaxID=1513592 RepID=A0ABQ0MXU6_9GAMM|nr:hypothetical protein MTCD1_02092 [Colwellia marinimaniae]
MHETPPFLINLSYHYLFANRLACIVSAGFMEKLRNITFARSMRIYSIE